MAEADEAGTLAAGQRLDKWLWFARVIKSRTLAAGLVTEGKVRVNRRRVDKPSLTVRPGDVITVTVRGHVRVLKVTAPGARRGPPAEARTLFEEVVPAVRDPDAPVPVGTPPRSAGEIAAEHNAAQTSIGVRAAGSGRPTKRERRHLTRLTDGDD